MMQSDAKTRNARYSYSTTRFYARAHVSERIIYITCDDARRLWPTRSDWWVCVVTNLPVDLPSRR